MSLWIFRTWRRKQTEPLFKTIEIYLDVLWNILKFVPLWVKSIHILSEARHTVPINNIILDIWANPSISFYYSSVLESFECDWEVQCLRIWLGLSWIGMFYARQILITNTSLLYHQIWVQERMLQGSLSFVPVE